MTASVDARCGPLFWTGVVMGTALMAVGVVELFGSPDLSPPADVARWVVVFALVHDLVVAPLAIAVGVVTGRLLPSRARPVVQVALLVSAVVALFSVPFVAGWGRPADNLSILPRNYGRGLVVVLSLVWAVAAVVLFRRLRRARAVPGAP